MATIALINLNSSELTQLNSPFQDCTLQEMSSIVGGGHGGGGYGGGGAPEGSTIYYSSFGPGNSGEDIIYSNGGQTFQYHRHGSKSSTVLIGP